MKKSNGKNEFWFRVVLKSLLIGAVAGLVTVAFRAGVTQIFSAAQNLIPMAQENGWLILLWFAIILLAAFVVARLLKWEPDISGSGIPQLEGELKGLFSQHPLKILIGKFFGGLLSLGAGLSLGREGPCIQMGAMIGKGFSRKKNDEEKALLMTSGGAAGLAAAFGAPLAGILFALEEVHKSFSVRILFTAAAACTTSGVVTWLLLGSAPIFNVHITEAFPLDAYWSLLLLGVVSGAFGALYNLAVKKMQNGYAKMKKIPSQYRLLLPFLLSGVLAFFLPAILGGGASLVGHITSGSFSLLVLLLLLAAKFTFSVFCFSSGVPGGILMPMLVMGALMGGAFGLFASETLGLPAALLQNFVLCTMAALFGAIVRAPLTGIVLVCEMTGTYSLFLPLIVTTLTACLIAKLLGAKPVYDQLLERRVAERPLR